jgi:hypothetical protein
MIKILLIISTILFIILNVFYIKDNKSFLDESEEKFRGLYEFNFILRYISIILNLLFLVFYYMKEITYNKYIIYYLVIDNTFNILFYLLHFNIIRIIFQFSVYLILLSEYNINSYNVQDYVDIHEENGLPSPTISIDSVILKVESNPEPNYWYNETDEGKNVYGNAYDEKDIGND